MAVDRRRGCALMLGRASQLDEISAKIGELTAYNHEHRHGTNNVSQKIDALSIQVNRQLDRVEQKLGDRIDLTERKLGERIEGSERTLTQRVEKIEAEMTGQLAKVETETRTQLGDVCRRIDVLETDKDRREGLRGGLAWVVDKWPSLTAAGATVATFAKLKGWI